MRLREQRGVVLLSSYLLLSLFLIYSNAMALRTMHESRLTSLRRNQMQARYLAQAAGEQLRNDLDSFLQGTANPLWVSTGNAAGALGWLDQLSGMLSGQTTQPESPMFDLPLQDTNGDGRYTSADADGVRDGTAANPRVITLPDGTGRAWFTTIISENPGDPLATRDVTIKAEATVGGITKRIQTTCAIEMGTSDVFRYVYFINNYGWFKTNGDDYIRVNGEIRSNGDLSFSEPDEPWKMTVNGDVAASQNPILENPFIAGQPATGAITGDPFQDSMGEYWNWGTGGARPPRQLTFPGQPAIGGSPTTLPDTGIAYDSENPRDRLEGQPAMALPYLGDLDFYKQLEQQNSGSLTYIDRDTGNRVTIDSANPYTSSKPLVLVGGWWDGFEIEVNGPVVIPGDVVIKGVVKGKGTIYAGRNVHVVGDIFYKNAPYWHGLERDANTGLIRQQWYGYDAGGTSYDETNLGTVCNNGAYYAPGVAPPGGCVP